MVIQNWTQKGTKADKSRKSASFGLQNYKPARKEAKTWSKKELLLERPGVGGFVIDFRADVREVLHAHRIFEAPAQKPLRGHLALQV